MDPVIQIEHPKTVGVDKSGFRVEHAHVKVGLSVHKLGLSLALMMIWLISLWFLVPNFSPFQLRAAPKSDVLVIGGASGDVPTPLVSQVDRTYWKAKRHDNGIKRQASFVLPLKDGVSIIVPRLASDTDLWVNNIPLGSTEGVCVAGPAVGPMQSITHVGPIFMGFSPNRFDLLAKSGFSRFGVGPIWFANLEQGRAFATALRRHQDLLGRLSWVIGLIGAFACGIGLFFRAERWVFGTAILPCIALLMPNTPLVQPVALWITVGLCALLCWRLVQASRPIVSSLLGCAFVTSVASLSLLFWYPEPAIYLKIASLSVFGLWPFVGLGLPFLTLTHIRRLLHEFQGAQLKIADQEAIIQSQVIDLHAAIRSSAINEERQRFVRDMHDGVGGQLLSLLMQVRSGSIKTDGIEAELQRGLYDLRLMADSLDHVGDDLEVALTAFERRAAQQLASAKIALSWRRGEDLNTLAWDGRKILNLYRILQEALTNCIRHSGATKIAFDFALDATRSGLIVSILDNGTGIGASSSLGRGLTNMGKRATALGCVLTYADGPDGKGTLVSLQPRLR
jgi:signal transduction histidine kinase